MPDLIKRQRRTTPNEHLVIKELADLQIWRSGQLSRQLYEWIALANAIAVTHFHRCLRVTAIKKAGPFHKDCEAADVSACSDGEAAYFGDLAWDEETAERFETMCIEKGIPMMRIYKGKPNEHWHIGPIATVFYQND